MYDLIIIGAGPAGSSAAITAARTGAQVLLLERGRFPRHKVCGEFVSAESLGLLGGLLGSQHGHLLDEAVRIPQGRLFLDGRVITTAINPPAASVARFDLDLALLDPARDCGVDTRVSIAVQSINGRGPFQVATAEAIFEARAVVNASGRWSNLNAAPANGAEKWLGVKGHFAEDSPPRSVDLYFFDGGYCGVQPVDLQQDDSRHGRINACAMVKAGVASNLAEVFAQNPALAERSRNWRPLTDPVSTSPLIFRQPQTMRDGVFLAGDAAAFVDPFVGDGISLALRSGALAAQCLLPFFRGELTLAQAAAAYSQRYRQQLAPVFRASSKLRQALTLPRAVRTPILAFIQRVPAAAEYMVRKTR